jgi:hypothetical protein
VIADEKYKTLLQDKIRFYEQEILKYENEQYFEKHTIARLFRPKTYKRLVKRKLLQMLGR